MNDALLSKIRSLPPLPETVMELQKVCSNPDASLADLAKIIEKDPMVTANLIKAANSPFYGFSREIASVAQAVSLFGMSTVKGIAMSNSVANALKIDLAPYGIKPSRFAELSSMQNALLQKWKPSGDKKIMDTLITASFLQETGKVIISQEVIRLEKTNEFKEKIQTGVMSEVEMEYVSETTASTTAAIFEFWRFEESVIDAIKASDEPLKAEGDVRFCASVLNVLKCVVDTLAPFSDTAIELANKRASQYGIKTPQLDAAIAAMKENL